MGRALRLTTFGESHGPAIGGILDGFPSGIPIDFTLVDQELVRRRSAQTIGSGRNEKDQVEYLSGIFEGQSLGSPIAFIIPNRDARSVDYDELQEVFRPSHADYVYQSKYGLRDYRGGGRSSARETTNWVVAGSFAQMLLRPLGITNTAVTSSIGGIDSDPTRLFEENREGNELNCPDLEAAEKMREAIALARQQGDSLGGIITCRIKGLPIGWGEPIFDKLHARLAQAMMSLNAARGFEIGEGFQAASMSGSRHNDPFEATSPGNFAPTTNHSGGVQGGISNGKDLLFRVAIKPVASIKQPQQTVDTLGNPRQITILGRHDVCVVPRATVIVEALAWLVLADFHLLAKLNA